MTRKRRLSLPVYVAVLSLTYPALAQKPMTVADGALSLSRVGKVTVPRIDVKEARAEDLRRQGQDLPPRYAIPTPTRRTPATDGTWEDLGNGLHMWRLRVGSPGARSINLGFTRYRLPVGARLLIYSADGRHIIRPFTSRDNESHGQLWTPPIPSDDIVVELTIRADTRPALDLELGSINIGYRDFGPQVAAASGSCNVDVVCSEGDDWRDQIQSVAVLSLGGGTFCTGFAVNNTAGDLTPYFMTANHCGVNGGNAASLVVFWNFQNSTCRAPGSPASGGPGDGTLSDFQSGSFFRAGSVPSDFTLVQLDDDPNPLWNVVLAGWDRTSADAVQAVGIHHPNTDEKRISFENNPLSTTSWGGNSIPGDGTHTRVFDWDLGTTEGGSSGSPLFNQDHRVIGQLHGGGAACGNNLSDWYGRFSVSWDGSSPSTRLRDWLDPGNTGVTKIDHVSTAGMNVDPAGDVLHFGVVGGPFTNPTVVYTLSNPTPTSIDFDVSLTAAFGILLDGGTAPISGTLSPSGGTRVITLSLGADVDALPAGVNVETVLFDDLTNAITFTRRHTVEIGQTLVTVVPDTDFESAGPEGGPFDAQVVYTVTSERPSPVTVEVSAGAPWIALNGSTEPLTLNLAGTGDFVDIAVGFSAAADSLAVGLHTADVTFTTTGDGNTARTITLDVGRILYSSTDTPQGIADNSTLTSVINVTDDFCIADVNVDVDISHTWIGDLSIELVSPSGAVVRLHDRTGGDADDIRLTYDDEGTPPDGPGTLGDFDVENVLGAWTLRVSDNANGDTGSLNSWALRVSPISGECPVLELIHDFPLNMDPGWSTEGQWAFGQPSGGGSNGSDPTSGFTGPNVFGYNLLGDYANNLGTAEHLTTGPIDCSDSTLTRLQFQRWLGVESAIFDRADIQVSNDGTTWTTVWEHTGDAISDSSWVFQNFSIATVADGSATVFIRWGMGPTDGSVTFPGWNLDDIEIWGVRSADCNDNGISDDDDIAAGTSEDCTGNGIPDECEPDCDVNGTADSCDIASCPLENVTCQDCNENGVLDECDIRDGSPDDDLNGVPDVCECLPSAMPQPETIGVDISTKNRFLSFSAGDAEQMQAVRVTFDALPAPFNLWDGAELWVSPTSQVSEAGADIAPSGGPTFTAATLQCVPFLTDWSVLGTVHVFHEGIVPGGNYRVEVIHEACDAGVATNFSDPLFMTTAIWGDTLESLSVSPPPPPEGEVKISDALGVLGRFVGAPGSIVKARADLEPGCVDLKVNISDVLSSLSGFVGLNYPFAPTAADPCDSTCSNVLP